MNVRERVLAVLNGLKPDYVPWFGDLSYWVHYLNCSGQLPHKYVGNGLFQLHKDLGVGFYLQGWAPVKTIYNGVSADHKTDGDYNITRLITPVGVLQQVSKNISESYTVGIQEHFVKNDEDLGILRYWLEHLSYEPDYEYVTERYNLVGNNGLVLCYLPKSPLMQMMVEYAGVVDTAYLMADYPEEFDETMAVIRKKADEAAGIIVESPAECLMIPENLSSENAGKKLFESYMKDYEAYWTKKIKAAGKYSFIHMDGTLKGLISEVSRAGFTVLEALTPSPVGDLSIEDIHKFVEKDSVIWGGLPGLYFTDLVSDREFDEFVINTLEVMKTSSRYVLGVADQVPPGSRWQRIKRVGELVGQYGKY